MEQATNVVYTEMNLADRKFVLVVSDTELSKSVVTTSGYPKYFPNLKEELLPLDLYMPFVYINKQVKESLTEEQFELLCVGTMLTIKHMDFESGYMETCGENKEVVIYRAKNMRQMFTDVINMFGYEPVKELKNVIRDHVAKSPAFIYSITKNGYTVEEISAEIKKAGDDLMLSIKAELEAKE